jgi:hypothetical protein
MKRSTPLSERLVAGLMFAFLLQSPAAGQGNVEPHGMRHLVTWKAGQEIRQGLLVTEFATDVGTVSRLLLISPEKNRAILTLTMDPNRARSEITLRDDESGWSVVLRYEYPGLPAMNLQEYFNALGYRNPRELSRAIVYLGTSDGVSIETSIAYDPLPDELLRSGLEALHAHPEQRELVEGLPTSIREVIDFLDGWVTRMSPDTSRMGVAAHFYDLIWYLQHMRPASAREPEAQPRSWAEENGVGRLGTSLTEPGELALASQFKSLPENVDPLEGVHLGEWE